MKSYHLFTALIFTMFFYALFCMPQMAVFGRDVSVQCSTVSMNTVYTVSARVGLSSQRQDTYALPQRSLCATPEAQLPAPKKSPKNDSSGRFLSVLLAVSLQLPALLFLSWRNLAAVIF